MESVGISDPAEPPVWNEETRQSWKVMVRYGRGSLPARRQVMMALEIWSPVAQVRSSLGLALLMAMAKEKSCMLTLPDPWPPPPAAEPELDSPQAQLKSSISFA